MSTDFTLASLRRGINASSSAEKINDYIKELFKHSKYKIIPKVIAAEYRQQFVCNLPGHPSQYEGQQDTRSIQWLIRYYLRSKPKPEECYLAWFEGCTSFASTTFSGVLSYHACLVIISLKVIAIFSPGSNSPERLRDLSGPRLLRHFFEKLNRDPRLKNWKPDILFKASMDDRKTCRLQCFRELSSLQNILPSIETLQQLGYVKLRR